MAYTLPALPYAYNALEPYIDEETMRIHHTKHHQAYIDNVNKALEGTEFAGKPIEEIIKGLDKLPEKIKTAVRNNGGGHYNHSIFWEIMGPNGKGKPEGPCLTRSKRTLAALKPFRRPLKPPAKPSSALAGPGW